MKSFEIKPEHCIQDCAGIKKVVKAEVGAKGSPLVQPREGAFEI